MKLSKKDYILLLFACHYTKNAYELTVDESYKICNKLTLYKLASFNEEESWTNEAKDAWHPTIKGKWIAFRYLQKS